jgi:uncharacterized protein
LSQAELDMLGDFLGADDAPEDRMPIATCEGFFAALHSGPELVPPSEWLPIVLGEDAPPRFESQDDYGLMLSLIMRFYNEVGTLLADPYTDYAPANGDETGALSVGAAVLWAIGYVTGVSLRSDAWEPIVRSEAGEAILPIYELARFADPKTRKPLDSARTRRDAEKLADSAIDIYDFWLEHRHTPIRRTAPKIGPNERCHCGSGRKYKTCCGKA